MFREFPKIDGSPESALASILESYPVKQEDVDSIIGTIEEINKPKDNKTIQLIDPVGSLMAQAGWEAERSGVKTVPTILAAVSQLEKDTPSSEKKLTPSKYLEFLAKAETSATARSFWDNTISHSEQLENAAIHAAKADKLYKILLHSHTLG